MEDLKCNIELFEISYDVHKFYDFMQSRLEMFGKIFCYGMHRILDISF